MTFTSALTHGATGDTAAPAEPRFDYPPEAAPCSLDDFNNRTVAQATTVADVAGDTLGASSAGVALRAASPWGVASIGVVSGRLLMETTETDYISRDFQLLASDGLPTVNGDWVATWRFRLNFVPVTGTQYMGVYLTVRDSTTPSARMVGLDLYITNRAAFGDDVSLYGTGAASVDLAKHDWAVDRWYTAELLLAGTAIEARIWDEMESRPASPTASTVVATGSWAGPVARIDWYAMDLNINDVVDPARPATLRVEADDLTLCAS